MFDFSFTELGLVGLVSYLVLGPKDSILFLKSIQKFIHNAKKHFEEYTSYLNDSLKEVEEEGNVVDMILDQDGKYQKVYDLSKIMPEIKETKAADEQ